MPRLEAGVGVGEPHRVHVELVGRLQPLRRLAAVVADIGHQPAVEQPVDRELRLGEAVDRLQRLLQVAVAHIGPGGEQGRREVGIPPPAARLLEMAARRDELPVPERPDAERQEGERVVGIALQHALRQAEGLVEGAILHRGDEGPLQEFGVAGIFPERLAEVMSRGARVARGIGHESSEEVARRGFSGGERLRRIAGLGGSRQPEADAGRDDADPQGTQAQPGFRRPPGGTPGRSPGVAGVIMVRHSDSLGFRMRIRLHSLNGSALIGKEDRVSRPHFDPSHAEVIPAAVDIAA